MSIYSIQQSSFALKPLNEDAYALTVNFLNGKGSSLSSKEFIFMQQPLPQEGELLDIYSLNGTCAEKLFTSKDVSEMKPIAAKLQSLGAPLPTIITVDIKDFDRSYLNGEEISEKEKVVCDFFQSGTFDPFFSRHASKIQSVTKSFPQGQKMDFAFLEGSLKKDLLAHFSDEQAGFFLSKENKLGPIGFCQCAEFFMHGTKLGQKVNGISYEEYIQSFSNQLFTPFKTSTVWFPKRYAQIYSLDGAIAQQFSSVFSVTGYVDAKEITEWNVEKKS